MSDEVLELLAWAARGRRTYAEAMDVWQTSCPRHSVWEDALNDELIEVADGARGSMAQSTVTLTPRGRALLATGEFADNTRAACL